MGCSFYITRWYSNKDDISRLKNEVPKQEVGDFHLKN
jgi:hypothetical protein